MSYHPNEPDAAQLDGMAGTWSFLKGLLDEMPRYPRITVHAEAIATAAPKPAPDLSYAPPSARKVEPIELIVDLTLEPAADRAPELVDLPVRERIRVPAAARPTEPVSKRVRRGATVLPLRAPRTRTRGSRAGRRLVA